MNIIKLYDDLKSNYKSYLESFVTIKDKSIEEECGEGCINETFRVLKDNEIRQYGEYHTKRFVMEAWYKFGYDR